ncbi:MAG: transcription antitermination factor NusB [Gammaproteobacteria bacterium]|nr:MAG: transcription antitermination factor NusB [Gammaproteobacteria bacterium]
MSKAGSPGTRSRARELALQALYQLQLTDHSAAELLSQFHERPEYARVDRDYFDGLMSGVCERRPQLQERIAAFADRPVVQLDPVELAILLIGFHELEWQPEVPFRVVINESVKLAKRFGAVDGHKYVNAVLDRAVATLRPGEQR